MLAVPQGARPGKAGERWWDECDEEAAVVVTVSGSFGLGGTATYDNRATLPVRLRGRRVDDPGGGAGGTRLTPGSAIAFPQPTGTLPAHPGWLSARPALEDETRSGDTAGS
ncbi:hypothetical protein GCM10012286_57330 [Streptomyces lasiicapitis]|uniref:Uncharacterized protein n=1 Tax=Streptomyces lasiicapitis TaxID=1923961 RepID=A0ABQ2MIK3_9ACTN|nr:hypothetical protein GCM10012286_57330 [Streptomyces lasiicapitis]